MDTLTALKTLSPSEFDEVVLRYGMPVEHLPEGSQAQKSIVLIRYAKERNELETLDGIIATIRAHQIPPATRKLKRFWLWFALADSVVMLALVLFFTRVYWLPSSVTPGPGVVILQNCTPQMLEQADALFRQTCPNGAARCGPDGLRKVLELCPEHPEANNNLADVYEKLGDYPTAAEYYQRAAHGGENFWQAWFNLGEIQSRYLNNPAAALFAYAHACNHPPALERIAVLRPTTTVPAEQQAELQTLLRGCGF